jgi:hypothetical protein
MHHAVPCEIFEEGYFYTKNKAKVKPIMSAGDLLFYGKLPEKQRLKAQSSLRPVISKSEKARMKMDKMAERIAKLQKGQQAMS